MTSPIDEAEGSKILESEQMSLTDENAEFYGLETQIDHQLSKEDIHNLPLEIKDLCQEFPTYFVNYTKTSQSKNKFMDDDAVTDEMPTPKDQNMKKMRFKRHYQFSECEIADSKVDLYVMIFVRLF